MKLKFLHLSIENFLSLGNVELDLNDLGYTLINGINNNPTDNATSNGVGKSAIFDALVWALTGETVKGISRNISNIHAEGGAGVCITFSVDNTEYKICRYKDHKKFGTNLLIYINGEDKSGKGIRDSEKLLAEYLPDLTLQFIGSVIVFGQKLPQRFTNNTPSGRKDVLEKLSKSDFMIEDIKNRLGNRKLALNQQIREVEDTLLSLSSKKSILQRQLNEKIEEQSNLKESAELLANMSQAENKVKELTHLIEETKLELAFDEDQYNQAIQSRDLKQRELTEEMSALNDKYTQILSEKLTLVSQLDGQVKALNLEINRLKNIKDVCPTCGQKLPNVHKVDTSDKELERDRLKEEFNKAQDELNGINYRKSKDGETIKKKYESALLEADNAYRQLAQQMASLKNFIRNTSNECDHWRDLYTTNKVKYESAEQYKETLKKTIENLNKEIKEIEANEEVANTSKGSLKSSLDVVTKMISIATRDFRGFLLSNVINYINARAKSYSKDIFGTDKIEFSLNGNSIDISYDDKMYENLSGGEAQKVDIIINLSLRDMLCQFSNFSSNILVLDEITDALDALGCAKVIDVITKRLTDIESVFIITHRAELMIPADTTITVYKEADGISRVA